MVIPFRYNRHHRQAIVTTTNTVLTIGGVSDTFSVTTKADNPPVANAGPDPSVRIGSTVILNGSGSSDPDGDTITYSWSISSKPKGSKAKLTNLKSVSPTFIADKKGKYVVSLTVNDGTLKSTDTVTVTGM